MIRAGFATACVLALTACAVLAGATSLLAVGEWIADAPAHVLEQAGAHLDPLLPTRVLPAETTVRRLLARIDGDALDQLESTTSRPTSAAMPATPAAPSHSSASRDHKPDVTRQRRSPGAAEE
ncbi:transposase family protein [Streptomyces sp. A3M-1-3]|uniref:transposase family protein n=1 Tax=Streptomyces sp. A3M-1-3 TaxID=2962044 RepID=UPI0020B84ABB|nr:transposase family protein [Streptomyces sp. A3M-1-3]MCP3822710.1 transposase family protein [Streptomyces sp. A3M-1-3]